MTALAALALTAPCQAKNNSLENTYLALSAGATARGAQWGVYIADAATGKPLLAHNQDSRLIPASTLKLFVTAAALSELGPQYRFKTEVYSAGDIHDGNLSGDLVIVGGGDPALGSTVIAGAPSYSAVLDSWAQAVEKAGIRRISGSIVADVSLFDGLPVPDSWPYEDLGNYYAAQESALSINDNLYKLFFKTGKPGEPAQILRTEPAMPGLSFKNFMLTDPAGTGDKGYIFRAPGQFEAQLRGTEGASANEVAIKGSMPDPALFTAGEFAKILAQHGIHADGEARVSFTPLPRKQLLAQTLSMPLKDIVFETNKRSFNFYAEMLLRALAVHAGEKGTQPAGLARLRAFLAQANVEQDSVKLDDACGLSKNDLATARALAQILIHERKSQTAQDFSASLPVPGDQYTTGHIKHFASGSALEGKISLKSGSLTGVRSYAGYLKAKSGRPLVFAFIINGYNASGDEVDKLHEELLSAAFAAF